MMLASSKLRGELRHNQPLSKYTSWRVGGIAKQLYRPKDTEDLALFLAQLPEDEPIIWLGLGSNVLIRDGGFSGTIISVSGILQHCVISNHELTAEAGLYCSKLSKQAAKAGLSGAAFFSGIPGTLGGALAMNAGAYGTETWSLVSSVTTLDRRGQIHQRQADEFDIGYRHVKRPNDEWFIAATIQLEIGDRAQEIEQIKNLLKHRNQTQPANQPCAGSVFRNPENDYAGRLIESVGLKGYSIGGARISEKHANFIVNTGNATASDIEALMDLAQNKVMDAYHVALQPEIHILGDIET